MRIYATSFQVHNLNAEFERLKESGDHFTLAPTDAGPVRMAVLDDTCGNLIQLKQMMDE